MSVLGKMTSVEAIALEEKYGAHNYHPLPVVLNRGEGVYVWDVDGKRYYEIESINEVQKNYKNLKIKIGDLEKDIDSEGDSEIISLENMKVKVEDGTVSVSFDELNNFNQGMELKYDILSNRNEIIDRIKLKFYMEN